MNSYTRKVNTVSRPVTDKHDFAVRSNAAGYVLLGVLVAIAIVVIRTIAGLV